MLDDRGKPHVETHYTPAAGVQINFQDVGIAVLRDTLIVCDNYAHSDAEKFYIWDNERGFIMSSVEDIARILVNSDDNKVNQELSVADICRQLRGASSIQLLHKERLPQLYLSTAHPRIFPAGTELLAGFCS
jgi:hypothetical protein